jgi:hypothetical protein
MQYASSLKSAFYDKTLPKWYYINKNVGGKQKQWARGGRQTGSKVGKKRPEAREAGTWGAGVDLNKISSTPIRNFSLSII